MAKLFSLLPKQQLQLKNLLKILKPKTNICLYCFKAKGDSFINIFHETYLCKKCFSEFKVIFKREKFEQIEILSIFEYNDFLKTMLYNLKAVGDVALAPAFLNYYYHYLKTIFIGYYLVPAPSTASSDLERGFNHVIALFSCLGLPFLSVFTKKEDFKQSDQSFHERQNVINKLEITQGEMITGKKILIVDDLKTSGATIKAMINLITRYNPKMIRVLTISTTTLKL